MEIKYVYEAFDGKKFYTRDECVRYEARRKLILDHSKNIKMYDACGVATEDPLKAFFIAFYTSDAEDAFNNICYEHQLLAPAECDDLVGDKGYPDNLIFWDSEAGNWKSVKEYLEFANFMAELFKEDLIDEK